MMYMCKILRNEDIYLVRVFELPLLYVACPEVTIQPFPTSYLLVLF